MALFRSFAPVGGFTALNLAVERGEAAEEQGDGARRRLDQARRRRLGGGGAGHLPSLGDYWM